MSVSQIANGTSQDPFEPCSFANNEWDFLPIDPPHLVCDVHGWHATWIVYASDPEAQLAGEDVGRCGFVEDYVSYELRSASDLEREARWLDERGERLELARAKRDRAAFIRANLENRVVE